MIHLIGWILISVPVITIAAGVVVIIVKATKDALAGDPDAQLIAIALWGLIILAVMLFAGACLISV